MSTPASPHADARWSEADRAWRDPAQVVAWSRGLDQIDPALLRTKASSDWWGLLERLDACLVISREYEHLLLALAVTSAGPRQSFMSLPHPSGLAFDAGSGRLHVASTRNPNQLYQLGAVACAGACGDPEGGAACERPLAPLSASFLPGRLYLHDLALIGGVLHGNAVGLNAIVRFSGCGGAYEVVWWPRAIEHDGRPDLSRNYLQLNSIAAGADLRGSFFSASAAEPSLRRPGHRNFPVDRRGVIFSGLTREPIAHGLTRPHSARLRDGEIWVNDSGYGRVGRVREGVLETVAALPGWTRGLTFCGDVAFVGTSRVIPRFAHYAPGLRVQDSVCAVHALDTRSGESLASIAWPAGNQIFDIAVLPRTSTLGFPAAAGRSRGQRALSSFFFSYRIPDHQEPHE